MGIMKEIINAYSVDKVSETYEGTVEITDLKKELGTKGHVLVVRGDKAYADKLGGNKDLANPKFWMYENLIKTPRIQEALNQNPNHKLFDGVGFSALDALGFHSGKLGRKAVAVMAREHIPDKEVFERYPIEVIHGEGLGEEGYVDKQAEVLSSRNDLIPFHQALYGAQALAPIGNKVVNKLEELSIKPDETYWCIASGSNLYGIGHKIKQKFSDCSTFVVEPKINMTVDSKIDLTNSSQIKSFAKNKLRNYSLKNWNKHYAVAPLHAAGPSRYLLLLWANTGKIGFDKVMHLPSKDFINTKKKLQELNSDYNWTKTTALTIYPAIESAKRGKNVVVMAYGKHREHNLKDLIINGEIKK